MLYRNINFDLNTVSDTNVLAGAAADGGLFVSGIVYETTA